MTTAFDTLSAARDMEQAGLKRAAAEAVAIRAGQGELATKADLDALQAATRADIATLRWVIGIHLAISLATLAAVLAIAFRF